MSDLPEDQEALLQQSAERNGWSAEKLAEIRQLVARAYEEIRGARPLVRGVGTYERAKPNDEAVHVYVMVARANGDVKIGISQNPQWRRQALSKEWRGDLALVWFTEAYSRRLATDIERRAHEAMGDCRLDGEWFACSPDDAISAVQGAECCAQEQAA